MRSTLVILGLAVATAVAIVACGGDDEGGMYCCRYETRSTGCGGIGWGDWEAREESFNIDDYQSDWTPERVCNKYTGSGTECGGSCCINYEYRNNVLSDGAC